MLGHEGGYVNNPRDLGGETKWGISKRSYPHLDIESLTREEAIEIYREDFWMPIGGQNLSPGMAYQALDAAINSGIGNAIRFLQRAIGVADDGRVGPITLDALRTTSDSDLVMNYLAERLEFMTKLSNWPNASRGWARRIAQNLRYGAEDTD